MNYILLIPLVALCAQSCSISHQRARDTELQTISLIDRNGITETINNPERIKLYQSVNFLAPQPYQKVYRIHKRDTQGNIPSYLHSYHENGQVKQYLEVKNSRALGQYKEWYPNGRLKTHTFIIGGEADLSDGAEKTWIFDGTAHAWDEDGNLITEIYYQKGQLQGHSLYYHPNGTIWKKIPYQDNLIHGTFEVYLDNGQIFQKSEFQRGQLHGPAFRFWPGCDRLAYEEEYVDGELKYGKYYDLCGGLISEVSEGNGYRAVFGKSDLAELHEIRNGIPEGEVRMFGTDKKLMRLYHCRNGLLHGEETEYYEIPGKRHIPKILVTWYEGKIQGIVKTWYDNGVQECNREMSNNTKNGISTAWYSDGSLMMIEEYERDALMRGEYFRKGSQIPLSTIKEGSGTATIFDAEGNFLRKVQYDKGIPTGSI